MDCRTCQHPDREAIDRGILEGEPVAPLARRFTLSKDSVRRHRDSGHVSQALAPITTPDAGASALERTEVLYQLAEFLLRQAIAGRGGKPADLLREARLTLRQVSELRGELRQEARQVINIIGSEEWAQLRGLILGALSAHPEAKDAVAAALEDGS